MYTLYYHLFFVFITNLLMARVFPSVDSNEDGFLDSEEILSKISSNKMFRMNTKIMAVEKR